VPYVAGCEENQVKFHSQFDHIILLNARWRSSAEESRRFLADVQEVEPPGATASPAVTTGGDSRRRPIGRCMPGGVSRRARGSGAVLDGCAGYRWLALAGPYLDALGVRFLRLGYQDQQHAVLG
jgi:hypothetical protein